MIRYTDIMEITVKPVSDTIDIGEGFFHTNQLGFFLFGGGGVTTCYLSNNKDNANKFY